MSNTLDRIWSLTYACNSSLLHCSREKKLNIQFYGRWCMSKSVEIYLISFDKIEMKVMREEVCAQMNCFEQHKCNQLSILSVKFTSVHTFETISNSH